MDELDPTAQDAANTDDETDDELDEAEAQLVLDRLAGALAALDDASLRRALSTIGETNRQDIVNQLQLPRATMSLGDALVPIVRRKVRTAAPPRQLAVAFALSESVNDDTIAALGDRSDDPTHEDMLEVLPTIIERHGAPATTLMLASYAASDAQCQAVFAELLATDERFAIGEPVPIDETAGAVVTSRAKRDDDAQAEKRAQRKAAKDAKKAAEARQREAKARGAAKQKEAKRAAKKAHQ